jgi:hypothetical protein
MLHSFFNLISIVFTIVFFALNSFCQAHNEQHISFLAQDNEEIEADLNYLMKTIEQGPCNIPIENDPISLNDFLENYAYKSPVIFRQSVKEADRNVIFNEKCSFENLIKDYGDKHVTVSTANTHSYKKYTMRLDDYLNEHVLSKSKNSNYHKMKYGNETWYFFGENNYTEWKPLLDLYERPYYNLPNHEHAYSFGVAAFYTGVIIEYTFFMSRAKKFI